MSENYEGSVTGWPHSFKLPEQVTISGAVHLAEQYLRDRGIADAATDVWYLLEYAAGMRRASLLAELRSPFPESRKQSYSELIRMRGSHIPLQYLTGEQEFMGLSFRVTPDVLIPRQDTETLVEEALEWMRADPAAGLCRIAVSAQEENAIPEEAVEASAEVRFCAPGNGFNTTEENGPRPYRVLDLCTGSGCIAVSFAKPGSFGTASSAGAVSAPGCARRPLQVWASDISAAALAVARENAARSGAAVTFVESDLFAGLDPAQPFDLIVSNPPYVTDEEMETLDEEVRLHEPRTALCGGRDGLDFYRKIIRESRSFLRPQGCLMLEIGCGQAQAVTELMRENGFSKVRVKQDLAGKDRVVAGVLSGRESKHLRDRES